MIVIPPDQSTVRNFLVLVGNETPPHLLTLYLVEFEIVTKTKKRLIWLFSLVLAGAVVIFATVTLTGPADLPPVTDSQRNGYMELIAVVELIKGQAPDFETANDNQNRAFVEANREALSELRLALKLESRVPVVYNEKYIEVQAPRFQAIGRMARLLNAEGQLAKSEQRNADAIQSHLDLIILGQNSMRGGLLLDYHVGFGVVEKTGVRGLEGLREHFDAETTDTVLETLKSVRENREPFEEIAKREAYYLRNTHGELMSESIIEKATMETMKQYEEVAEKADAEMDALIKELSHHKPQPR